MERCDRFAENLRVLIGRYPFEYRLPLAWLAWQYALRDRTVDPAEWEPVRASLVSDKDLLGGLRSGAQILLTGAVVLHDDRDAFLETVRRADAALNTVFALSMPRIAAALMLAQETEPDRFCDVAQAARAIWDCLPDVSKFDIPYAVLCACVGRIGTAVPAGIESAATVLRPRLGDTETLRRVSYLLALCDDPVAAAKTALQQDADCRRQHLGLDRDGLGLATLVLSGCQDMAAVQTMSDRLRRQRGFGNWTLGRATRGMYAAWLTAGEHRLTESAMLAAVMEHVCQ